MARPHHPPIWQGHMAKPHGKAIWQSHIGIAIWQGYMPAAAAAAAAPLPVGAREPF